MTLETSNPLNCDAAQTVYAPMLSNPSQSPTCSAPGSCATAHTQSSESHVGPHTLLARSGADAGTWNEPLSESTNGAGLWWSNRMQLNAPYTPSLM